MDLHWIEWFCEIAIHLGSKAFFMICFHGMGRYGNNGQMFSCKLFNQHISKLRFHTKAR